MACPIPWGDHNECEVTKRTGALLGGAGRVGQPRGRAVVDGHPETVGVSTYGGRRAVEDVRSDRRADNHSVRKFSVSTAVRSH